MAIANPLTIDVSPARTVPTIITTKKRIKGVNQMVQESRFSGDRVRLTMTYSPFGKASGDARDLEAKLSALKTIEDQTFLADLFFYQGPNGDPGTGLTVDNAVSAGDNSIDITGLNTSTTVFKSGDWIGINDGSTYETKQIVGDVSSDSNGDATADVVPVFRNDFAQGDTVEAKNITGHWRLTNNEQGQWTIDALIHRGIVIECEEAD